MVNVWQWGRGPELLIALHGFGRNGQRFSELGGPLGERYTICAPDLPFHGNTRWSEEEYTRGEWREVVLRLAEVKDRDKFHLLGHSLGGRVALRISPRLHDRLQSLLLVAPDGLGGRYTGWIDYMPLFLRRRLTRLIERPDGMLRLARLLHHRGLIDVFTLQYLSYHLQDKNYRDRLRGTWRSLPHFRLKRRQILPYITQAEFPVCLLLGRHDRLIRVEKIERWFMGLERADIQIVPRGHELPAVEAVRFYHGLP